MCWGYGSLYIVENKNHFLVIFSVYSGVMRKRGGGRGVYGSLRHIIENKLWSLFKVIVTMHSDVMGKNL